MTKVEILPQCFELYSIFAMVFENIVEKGAIAAHYCEQFPLFQQCFKLSIKLDYFLILESYIFRLECFQNRDDSINIIQDNRSMYQTDIIAQFTIFYF